MNRTQLDEMIAFARNRQVTLRGHFAAPVRIEGVDPIGDGFLQVRVRSAQGGLDETVLTTEELAEALRASSVAVNVASPSDVFLWVEHERIRLAFAHDPYFAVGLSGVRGLPHQIEAVYRHLLPQPLLRFVLADDPGAGKTIMAGLLHKELKLRGVADRTLVVAPAPLTVQWQDEMANRFDEQFMVVAAPEVRWQMGGNPWQQHDQVITSLDFAKRDDVRPDLLRAEWDLVIIDEAHKCSAATFGDEMRRTMRYVLAEDLSRRSARVLLLTATPHSGDPDRFRNFLALLDPDQFATQELVRRQIALHDSPYFLRRQKEDLIDEHGHPLFVERRVVTQPFTLSPAELQLYDHVTDYINRFLGFLPGGRGQAVALARTVLQRRLASSLGAIRSSLEKRANRLLERADELERLPAAERRRRLVELGVLPRYDHEETEDDADEALEEEAATEITAAEHVDQLRVEVQELHRLTREAEQVIQLGEERKLTALRACLDRAELAEMRDGRGRLLIFTEHRDTLEYLSHHLRDWGYSVCTIHGGIPPTERRRIQQEFHQSRQICVATEAAGEGINLQFCHLMINYDLPWNPVRLEQRMGRIHRIGQESEVWVFNFCATNTVEGQLLARLSQKLEEMRAALQGRVYDVIGDLLAVNGLDFERLLRDTLANPRRRDASLEEIDALSADRLRYYEEEVGIAQATRVVDLSWVRRHDWESEERRLMPEYVERFFLEASGRARVRVEQRADGLYRVEHVPLELRDPQLPAVRRLGRPQLEYRKLTFHKEERERAENEDAVLLSPGHSRFAALIDVVVRRLEGDGLRGATAAYIDPATTVPYRIYFLTEEVVTEGRDGLPEPAYAELVAVIDDGTQFERAPADVLHDLTPNADGQPNAADPDRIRAAQNWVRAGVQAQATIAERMRRLRQADLRSTYLREAIAAERRRLESRWSEYDERVYRGEEQYRLQRDEMQRRMDELSRRESSKLESFARMGVVRPGAVAYLGSVSVTPPSVPDDPEVRVMRPDPAVEARAMKVAMAHEREEGWEPVDVSAARDGSGFDIRSVRDGEVRRIEVKGRGPAHGDVALYRTEWYAAQRFREGFWLYVVYSAGGDNERLVCIQDPAGRLRDVQEVSQVTGYRVPGESIEEFAR